MNHLPKLTADGADIISGEHVDRVMIAAAITSEQAQCIVRAVNTFDQARAALKLARRRLNEGMHGKIDAVMEHGGDPGIVKLLDEALAAMEATS